MNRAWTMASIAALALGACDAAGAGEVAGREEQAVSASGCRETVLPWGSGRGQVGLAPGGPERLARGPMAVAVEPTGAVLVLDQENGRALRVVAGGVEVAAEGIARHADDLAAGDGLAVGSELAGVVWLRDEKGAPAGEVAVPRALRGVVGIELGASRRVAVRTGLQERFVLGSPAAPRDLATVLRGKAEGAVATAAGGAAVLAGADGVELVVTRAAAGERAQVAARHRLPGAAQAAALFGAAGDIVCARVEAVDRATSTVRVERRAVCVDATTGAVVIDRRLPARGLYLPRQELALGGPAEAPRLASIHAAEDGLRVETCEVKR
ncbi:MAG TPA: hypothetical protein VMZ28_14645 [Kofleriaceae bacterium]|nr:hypothetical protein [Kofleriaceae bacterium]